MASSVVGRAGWLRPSPRLGMKVKNSAVLLGLASSLPTLKAAWLLLPLLSVFSHCTLQTHLELPELALAGGKLPAI